MSVYFDNIFKLKLKYFHNFKYFFFRLQNEVEFLQS
jgi:hypothetical protein